MNSMNVHEDPRILSLCRQSLLKPDSAYPGIAVGETVEIKTPIYAT